MKYKIKHILLVLLVVANSGFLLAQNKELSDSIKTKMQEKVNVLYGTQKYDRFIGNMDVVEGEKLRKTPAIMVNQALEGQLPGVFIRQNYGTPGEDLFSTTIRGQVGDVITLVDGVERELTPYDMDQIEEIKVLKDPVSKALYGGRISNGIIMVTTRRGKDGKSEFHASVTRGIKTPTVMPTYLNSYDFANNYNQALKNDNNGLLPVGQGYDQTALDAYKNHTNPYLYPDVDFMGQFLNKSMDLTKVSAEYYGGNKITKYYVHGGFQKEGGFETYAPKPRQTQAINLQGNLDSKFSEDIVLHANFNTSLVNKQYPASFNYATLSQRYPNAYPIIVRGDSVGGTAVFKDNPYAMEKQSGYILDNTLRMQADLSFDVNLGHVIEGLSFKPELSFDLYHRQNLNKIHQVGIYQISSFDLDGKPFGYNTLQDYKYTSGQSLGTSEFSERWGLTGTLAYKREFGKHAIDADLVYYISRYTVAGVFQDYKRENLGLRANYTYAGKYILEGVLNYAGSQSFTPDKRFKYLPAVGAGWLISNENFLKDVTAVNFLKVNASWGISGNGNIPVNLWRESWINYGSYAFNAGATLSTTALNTVSSALLDWPTQSETDISLEAKLLNHLTLKASYFNYLQEGYTAKGTSTIPFIVGNENFMPVINFGKTGLKGYEVELKYNGNVRDFNYEVGAHLTNSFNAKVKIDETPDPNFSTLGTPWNAVWGYHAVGTYSADDIAAIKAGNAGKGTNLPLVSYMDPKSLLVGNIKYQDVNGDGIIDKYDTKVIGNYSPDMMYGGDLRLSYKGFEVYAMVLGYGRFNNILNTSFYQINSTRKYSTVVTDGLPNGNPQPLLTTTTGTNDFQSSDYWIVDQSYIKLQNVSVSYSFPKNWIKSWKLSDLKLSLTGNDLMTFSKIKKSDPESLDAGVGNYPLFRTFAIGLSISL